MTNQLPMRRRWHLAALVSAMLAGVLAPAAPASALSTGTPPVMISPSNWQYTAGGYNVFVVAASGLPSVETISLSGTLPPGLSFQDIGDGLGVISGYNSPSVAGTPFTVTITASNGISPGAVQQLTMIAGTTTTATSVTASPNPVVRGGIATYTARVAPVPDGGTVDITDNGNAIPGCSSLPVNTSTGSASCSSTSLLAGAHQLRGDYSGYGLFLPSLGPGTYKMVVSPRPPAYWLATGNGRVFGLGTAPSLGNANTAAARGMAGTSSGTGYYVVGAGGGVFSFGDARFFGSVPGLGKRVSNIVAIAPTADARGYYLLGSDGGVFTFGDARFYGSLPGIGIRTQHVVGMVANPAGTGYLLVGRDGGVFTFGSARFFGSLPGINIRVTSIRAILAAAAGTGYVLVGADGGIFNFGTGVKFYGSLPGIGIRVTNIVGIALTQDEDGYYMAGSDGKVYGFGTAQVAPAPSGLQSNLPVTAIAGIPAPSRPAGSAQRIFQLMVEGLPNDRFQNVGGNGESYVGFSCSTCGPQYFVQGFSVSVFPSHYAALTYAVTLQKQALTLGLELARYIPQFVSGNAVLGPAPDRMVTAFVRAVGQPLLKIAL